MSWSVYRPGEGRWARLVALVAILAMGAFSAYRWHLWAGTKAWNAGLLPAVGVHQLTWSEVGAGILVVLFALFAYRTCFAKPKTSDFLIETEIELRKVTWPEWRPLFRASTELWGSAYVVIVVVIALGLFIFVVDLLLGQGSQLVFFSGR